MRRLRLAIPIIAVSMASALPFWGSIPAIAAPGRVLALTTANTLLSFDAAAPATVTAVPVVGLHPDSILVGMDFRPATGELMAIGLFGTIGRVYRIDPLSGSSTEIGLGFVVDRTAPTWSVDFDPTADRIRLVNSLGDSYRLNPTDGAIVATDTDIAPAVPSGVAYDRPVATATATTLFAIDDSAETLNFIGGPDGTPSPNAGVTTVRGSLGVVTDSAFVGFDISASGDAVASLRVAGSTGLYTIDLASGRAQLIGSIADGNVAVADLAFGGQFAQGGSQFTAVPPTRLLDTRTGASVPAPGSVIDLQVAGAGGVPANATAVVLNTTATEATAEGFVTVYPTGEARPTVSNQNLIAGQTRANLVTVKLGAGGQVSLFTQSGTHLIADVLGYYAPVTGTDGRFTALTPARLIDTRATTKLAEGETVSVPVLGRGGVPAAGVASVLVNIAGTEANLPGYITAYASGTARPGTSNLNLEFAGSTASNLAIVPVGADGQITVFSQSGAHIVVDVAGWYGDTTSRGGPSGMFVPVSPTRVLDTRSGLGGTVGPLAINDSLELTLAGAGAIPASGATAAIINLTAVEPSRAGFLTVYPTGQPLTEVSSLNVDIAGQNTPNLVGATLGTDGKVTDLVQAGGHVLADVAGWFTS